MTTPLTTITDRLRLAAAAYEAMAASGASPIAAAADLIPRGVHVTIVHPGFVRTAMTDKNRFKMPFLVEVDEAAAIIDRGIRAKARLVRFPLGLTAAISGSKLMPRSLRDAIVNRSRPRS